MYLFCIKVISKYLFISLTIYYNIPLTGTIVSYKVKLGTARVETKWKNEYEENDKNRY